MKNEKTNLRFHIHKIFSEHNLLISEEYPFNVIENWTHVYTRAGIGNALNSGGL